MTMLVMKTSAKSMEEQLVEMTHTIAKLTKTIDRKDLQIASLMNKVKAQAQNMDQSSQGLNHLSNVAPFPGDTPHASKMVQVKGQTMKFTLVASLFI